MQQAHLLESVEYNDENIVITELLETPFSKEIRIVMQSHQVMRDHESVFPIALEVVEGAVNLSVEGEIILMQKGELAALENGVKHHLEALDESIVRLTIFKDGGNALVNEVDL